MTRFIRSILLPGICLLLCFQAIAQDHSRWTLSEDGGIRWKVRPKETHADHVEMSGAFISAILHYGVTEGKLMQKVQLVFPMLRTLPNDTHASLMYEIDHNDLSPIKVEGRALEEYPEQFYHKGFLGYTSNTNAGLTIHHQLFPATSQAVFLDRIEILNTTNQTIVLELPNLEFAHTTAVKEGVSGAYTIKVVSNKAGQFRLAPREKLEYALIYSGKLSEAADVYVAPDYEFAKRNKLVENTFSDLAFESPDTVLNRLFSFAKLRAVESIYQTKGGLMHGPGGGRYYAAIWANDQAEYANPFFPFLGNLEGNESAINAFRHFARFMNDEYKPIPSSIVAEGLDYWNGAGDRGDMAMIAYGASRFALAYGHENTARELWPLIEWCLEYCQRKVNSDGVVSSDSDELEGRFPAGKANLNTASLYYDALISASYLGKALGIDSAVLAKYHAQAQALEVAIEQYFGRNVSGFETYRYYDGNETLRAWICTPLTVGIFKRREGTIQALFSDKLWTADGLASAAGSTTFWDRATLYALRGVFAAGETRQAMDFLRKYSKRRLLGEHVPYPVEAYPEGNQRHLSAESALYCRIITEGLFGIRPEGFSAFSFSPKLPDGWDKMALRNIKAFNETFDIEVKKAGNQRLIKVFNAQKTFFRGKVSNGSTVHIQL